jgi:hypothetical protein
MSKTVVYHCDECGARVKTIVPDGLCTPYITRAIPHWRPTNGWDCGGRCTSQFNDPAGGPSTHAWDTVPGGLVCRPLQP